MYLDEQNNFKLLVGGLPYYFPGTTVGFEGFNFIIGAPEVVLTDYDGTFDFGLFVPNGQTAVDIYDGDFDLINDSDDPNSPNCTACGFPPFPVSHFTASRGCAAGQPGG